MSSPTTLPKRLDSLTSLRWFAAFMVFLFHMRSFAPLPFITPLFTTGNYGVTFFFILSGFVLAFAATGKQKTSTFYWRRFSRIWPANFVALLIAIPVFYSFMPNPDHWWVHPVSIPILLLSVVVIQGWWSNPDIMFSGNPVSWSLTVEFFFYALFPFLYSLTRFIKARGTLIAGIVVWLTALGYQLFIWIVPGTGLTDLPSPVVHVGEFILGILLAHAVKLRYLTRIPTWVSFSLAGVLLFAAGVNVAFGRRGFSGQLFDHVTTPLVIAAFAFVVGAVASHDIRQKKSVLHWKPLIVLGEWSFAFYLVHSTCIYFTRGVIGTQPPKWSNLVWYLAMLIVSLLIAGALHLWVEKPLEKRLRQWWDARRDVRA